MGGKGSEFMERRGKPAFHSHAVNHETGKTLCGVRADFLCMDTSESADTLPDCPKCCAKIARAGENARLVSAGEWLA